MINLISKIKIVTLVLAMVVLPGLIIVPSMTVSAAIPAGCPGGPAGPPAPGTVCPEGSGAEVQTVTPQYIEDDCTDVNVSQDNCGILGYLVIMINVLAGLVGVVVVGSIVYAGIQYSMAGSDAQKVSAAKERIRNAIIALFFFIFMYGLLNYLVPGGVLQ